MANHAGGARKYYKEDLDKFLEAYKATNNMTRAAHKAGIVGGRTTILQIASKIEWFKLAIETIDEEWMDEVEEFMKQKSKKKLTAAQFMLGHHKLGRKRGYGTKSELTGKDGAPLSWASSYTTKASKPKEDSNG
ncbi:MAG: hypothetical protein M0R03_23480 [Novosphingobium sp.]|jgi:hypothetical protein|nr:hypothetical protein [Novosphingobium sp.]MDD5355020.1 hypothetical protein [Candidatus Omnitrophota bacterium]